MDVSYHRGLVTSCRSLSKYIKKEPTGQKPAGFCRFRLSGNLGAVLEFEDQSPIGVYRYGIDHCQPEPVIKFGEGFIAFRQFKHEGSYLVGLCLAFCFPSQHRFQATLGPFIPSFQGGVAGQVFLLIEGVAGVLCDALPGQFSDHLKLGTKIGNLGVDLGAIGQRMLNQPAGFQKVVPPGDELVVGYQEPLFQIRFCDVRCRTLLITAKLIVTLVFQRFIIFQRLRGPHEAHKGPTKAKTRPGKQPGRVFF